MTRTSRYRGSLFCAAFVLNFAFASAAAPAALDMVVGARNVVANKPVSDCSARAKTALNQVLQGAFEAGEGTGQWLGRAKPDGTGQSSAAAAIHCFPVNNGYVVTFTCAVQIPPNPDTATALCGKLTTAFNAGDASAPAHPTGGAAWRH